MKLNIDVSNGCDVWFSSDWHFFHKNVIKFDDRPFRDDKGEPDLHAMHEEIITKWNSRVKPNDTAFFVGDLTWASVEQTNPLIKRLNGKIHFVMGNHDRYQDILSYKRFLTVYDRVELKLFTGDKKKIHEFVIDHFPIYSWNKIRYGAIMVHGHEHHNLHHFDDTKFNYYEGRKAIDVGCNGHNYYPLSHKEIIERMSKV